MGKKSKEYLEFVRFHDCVSCGCAGPCFAHHARKLDSGRPIAGGKVSDFNAVSLCAPCHTNEHLGYPMDELELWQAAFALLREYCEEKLTD